MIVDGKVMDGKQSELIEKIERSANLIVTLCNSKFKTPTGFKASDFENLLEVKYIRDEAIDTAVKLLKYLEELNDTYV